MDYKDLIISTNYTYNHLQIQTNSLKQIQANLNFIN